MVGLIITCRNARVPLLTQDSYYAPLYTYFVLVPHIQLSSEPYRAAGQLHIVFDFYSVNIRKRVVGLVQMRYLRTAGRHSRLD